MTSHLKTIKVWVRKVVRHQDLQTNLDQILLKEQQTELGSHNRLDHQECLHPQEV